MVFAEFWYGDVLERVYTTTTDFEGWNSWPSIKEISESSSAWQTLELTDMDEGMRVALVRSTERDDLSYYVLINRPAMGNTFGANPTVRTKLSVNTQTEVLQQEDIEHVIWYNAILDGPRTRVENTSTHPGYQKHSIQPKNTQACVEDASVKLELKIWIISDSDGRYDSRNADEPTQHFWRCLSTHLTEEWYGNVEFYGLSNSNGRKLYAFSHIWEQPEFKDCVLNLPMPGEQQETAASETIAVQSHLDISSLPLPLRRRIPLSCKFELLALVLRYLYTNSICFSTSDTHNTSLVPTASETEAEGIYGLAVTLNLEALRKKALHFLQSTCTITNITSRTFASFARENPEVGKVYESYLLRKWKEVLSTEELENMLAPGTHSLKFLELARRQSHE